MKDIIKLFKQKWFSNAVSLCIAITFYLLLSNLDIFIGWLGEATRIFKPVILGIVFAYIINPICMFFDRKVFKFIKKGKLRYSASVAAGIFIVLVLFIVLLTAFVPQLVSSIVSFFSNAGTYTKVARSYLVEIAQVANSKGVDLSSVIESGNEVINNLLGVAPEQMNGIIMTSYNIGMGVADILLGVILAVYLLMDKRRMLAGIDRLMRALFNPKQYRETKVFLHRCNSIMISFVGFDLLDGLIVGVINWLFMMIMGMPYAVLISVVVGVTNLAPTFGPIAGAIISSLILVLESPLNAVIFLVFTVVLQIMDGYVIKPRIFGTSLGVPAVWILIALVIGGKLFGVLGIILGIPFAAIFTYIYDSFIDKKIEERKQRQMAKEKKPAKRQA